MALLYDASKNDIDCVTTSLQHNNNQVINIILRGMIDINHSHIIQNFLCVKLNFIITVI